MTSMFHKQQIQQRFPNGNWFDARPWEATELYRRHPAVVRTAMEALSTVIKPSWLANHVSDPTCDLHPVCLGLVDTHYLPFWQTFRIGNDIATVKNHIPDDKRKSIIDRILNSREL